MGLLKKKMDGSALLLAKVVKTLGESSRESDLLSVPFELRQIDDRRDSGLVNNLGNHGAILIGYRNVAMLATEDDDRNSGA